MVRDPKAKEEFAKTRTWAGIKYKDNEAGEGE
jgi:hypothetical protein